MPRILRRDNQLIPIPARTHPLPNFTLALLALVIICRVDEVAAATKASSSTKEASLVMLPIPADQAEPIDMAPSWRGETRMPAVGERMRWWPRGVEGGGTEAKFSIFGFQSVRRKIVGRERKKR